jgi:hypothetical protein
MEEVFRHVESLEDSDEDDEYVDFPMVFHEDEDGEFFDIEHEQIGEDEPIGYEDLQGVDPFTFRSNSNWYMFTKSS